MHQQFGPHQLPEKLIPKTIIRALRDLPIPIYGKGTNIRDWIYVTDHCEALNTVLEKGKPGEIYNVSAENEKNNIEIVKKIITKLNKPESLITFVEDRPGHDTRYSLNSKNPKTILELQSKIRRSAKLNHTMVPRQRTTLDTLCHRRYIASNTLKLGVSR